MTYNFNAGVELPDLSDYNLCNAWEKVEVERLSGKYIAESGDPGMQLEKDIAYNDLVNEWCAVACRPIGWLSLCTMCSTIHTV